MASASEKSALRIPHVWQATSWHTINLLYQGKLNALLVPAQCHPSTYLKGVRRFVTTHKTSANIGEITNIYC